MTRSVTEILAAAGVLVDGGTAHQLTYRTSDGRTHTATLVDTQGRLTRRRAEHLAARTAPRRALLICDTLTDAARIWATATSAANIAVTSTGEVVIAGHPHNTPAPRPGARGRRRSARWYAAHRICLLATTGLRQADIAAAVGVTQQAIARMHLPATPMAPADRRTLLTDWATTDAWAPARPTLVRTHWYGLDSPLRQAHAALAHAATLKVPAAATGEVAADQLRPWRVPTHATVYAAELLDLSPAGLQPATAADATLTLDVPDDETILRTAAWWATRGPRAAMPIADPVIVLRDLRSRLDDDAADQLTDWITDRH